MEERDVIVVEVHGEPRGQGSLTLWRSDDGTERAKHPPATVQFRNDVVYAARQAMTDADMLSGACAMDLFVRSKRPQSHYGTGRNAGVLKPSAPRWHVGTPDIDKVLRLVDDAFTTAGVWADDKHLVAVRVYDQYAGEGELPGLTAKVWVLEDA